jgi:galactonate dehydratase
VGSDVPWRNETVAQPIEINDGHIALPERPGPGIEVNEKVAAHHPYQVETPKRYFQADGSVADW